MKNLLIVLMMFGFMTQAFAEGADIKKQAPDPKNSGIHNGCIDTHRIDSFKYHDPSSAKVTLTGGKEVLVVFKKRCFGLRHNGVIYEPRNNRLCAGFDHVRVLEIGSICQIEQIVPFVEPEPEPKSEPESTEGV